MNIRGITALAASAVFATVAMAQGGISVIVDGNPVTFHGVGPQEVNGRVLVPLRGVLEQMGAYVDWEPAGQLVTAQRGNTTIELRIGETSARVNNNPVSLDVPAEIYRGNTMVPLRFMSQALGADVKWEPNQYAVVINTGSTAGARGQEYNNPPQAKAHIDLLTFDRTGWVASGSQITFRMHGTPGGTALLTIPGVASDIPMEEVTPGLYKLTWTVPSDRSRIDVRHLNPSVRLDVNNTESTYQYAPPAGDGMNALLVAPTLIEPRADEPIVNPMVVEGNASPDSRVRVHVDYSTNVGTATMIGKVTDIVVVADANGHFETRPIDLTSVVQGRGVHYKITVTTLGPRDQQSRATSVTVTR